MLKKIMARIYIMRYKKWDINLIIQSFGIPFARFFGSVLILCNDLT